MSTTQVVALAAWFLFLLGLMLAWQGWRRVRHGVAGTHR